MNEKNKIILLAIATIIIIGVIWYIESSKPPASGVNAVSVAITSQGAASTTAQGIDRSQALKHKTATYQPAVELIPGGKFINTDPFKLKDLIGKKVVLIDFWTYSCINCQRTTPYLNAWFQKYKDQGLVIIGVHTPEFDFEKVYENVAMAVKAAGIKYPVVQDNNHATWDAYQNQYWPHEYLIDIDGYIVHDKIGEGGYDQTEQEIQTALKERAAVLGLSDTVPTGIVNPSDVISINTSAVISPETYFGATRNQYLGNGTQNATGIQQLSIPSSIRSNILYLSGMWDFQSEFAKNITAGAHIVYKYSAKNVYLVGSAQTAVKLTVMLDGKPVGVERGSDVASDGTVTIKENRLYKLIQGSDYGEHTLEIIVNNAGFDGYTFTFG